jgi:two-component system response regulator FixJ
MSALSLQIRSASELPCRERQVLELLSIGETTKGIAMSMGLSPKTVELYRMRLMKRTSLYSYQELTLFAHRLGLVKQKV